MSTGYRALMLGVSLMGIAAMVEARETPAAVAPRQAPATAAPDAGPDARRRAAAIVARMTIDEKIKLAHGLFPPMAAGKTTDTLIPSAGHIDGIARREHSDWEADAEREF